MTPPVALNMPLLQAGKARITPSLPAPARPRARGRHQESADLQEDRSLCDCTCATVPVSSAAPPSAAPAPRGERVLDGVDTPARYGAEEFRWFLSAPLRTNSRSIWGVLILPAYVSDRQLARSEEHTSELQSQSNLV